MKGNSSRMMRQIVVGHTMSHSIGIPQSRRYEDSADYLKKVTLVKTFFVMCDPFKFKWWSHFLYIQSCGFIRSIGYVWTWRKRKNIRSLKIPGQANLNSWSSIQRKKIPLLNTTINQISPPTKSRPLCSVVTDLLSVLYITSHIGGADINNILHYHFPTISHKMWNEAQQDQV